MARSTALRALLAHLIDYAGLYPPAGLPLREVAEKFEAYLDSPDSWILNRLVLPAGKLSRTPLRPGWRISLLIENQPDELPPEVETFECKAARRFPLPTYCEAPLEAIPPGAFAKVRTGGLTPDMIPPAAQVADFLYAAAQRRVPFKATAGLHHPLRSLRPLTYAEDAEQAVMHGFVNVFTAAAFAWEGAERAMVVDILSDVDAAGFDFRENELRWRGHPLAAAKIEASRRDFAHSFGSCSFEEPVAELRELGWLE